MNRAHHRLPRPVGLPPRWRRASATTFDEVKLEAIAPPVGVTVAFGPALALVATLASVATLALALARPRACICATPFPARCVRGLPEPGTMAATGARFRDDVGRAEAARRNHLGAAFHEVRVAAGLHLRRATIPARHPDSMAMVAIGVMMLGMMAGVIGPGVSPCAVVRPCRSRRDKCDDGHRTQCQRNETKRPAKRKRLTHT